MSSAEETRREGSRLEVDDGEHCKLCGAELPGSETDPDGNRIVWTTREWKQIEKCPDCWARKELRKLKTECMDRYAGELSELLDVDMHDRVITPRWGENDE